MLTKITIISGFLGAGKTTLIKKLMDDSFSGQKIALIENEFGEIGIDGSILKQNGMQIRELNSGCICCTLSGNFDAALKDVVHQYHPDRILIEPSGVGKLSDIINTCARFSMRADSEIDSCLTVCDATKYLLYSKNFKEFYNDQVENARAIILSRTQKINTDQLSAIVKTIQKQNSKAPIITTPWEEINGNTILEAAQKGVSPLLNFTSLTEEQGHHSCHDDNCHGHSHLISDYNCSHHSADEAFEVWSTQTPNVFESKQIKQLLEKLPQYGTILRAKGIVPIKDGSWLQFDYIPDEISENSIVPDYTGRLCVIGQALNKSGLAELFGI